eukprot:3264978-Pyramimonas_sp.AAC.1
MSRLRAWCAPCLAEMLDPTQQFADDPYTFCARCFTEAYDEVTAFRVLDPHRHALLLNKLRGGLATTK